MVRELAELKAIRAPQIESRISRIDTRQGSDSRWTRSHGFTYPSVARPNGMTAWTPQTDLGDLIYDYRAATCLGIRGTHSPSPWMGDYGHFTVLPILGATGESLASLASGFRHDDEFASPVYYRIRLLRHRVTIEVTATIRSAVLRFRFENPAGSGVVIAGNGTPSWMRWKSQEGLLTGFAGGHSGTVPTAFGCHVFATLDSPMRAEQPAWNNEAGGMKPICLRPTRLVSTVEMRIGTSFIDVDQAYLNLEREVGDASFDEVVEENAGAWDGVLSRHAASFGQHTADPASASAAFDAAVYRSHLFPRALHEPDASGRNRHRSPYDGNVHAGVAYTDNGFWDTHRTVLPWFAMTRPTWFGEMIEGFMTAYRQSGWLPKWCSPGHRDCMCGTHLDAVIAEGIVRGIDGFDHQEAYAAIRRNAFVPGTDDGQVGRLGLEDYLRLGYVPADRVPYSVCRTLDFAYCDACIAQAASKLGHIGDAQQLRQRAGNYRNVWDAGVGFMRGRNADGSWLEPWDEFGWGGPYIEGGPWQHSWTVPHDPAGLAVLCGGPAAMLGRLATLLRTPPYFSVGQYGREIHEMTEMAAIDFGQYAHSNQPSHHILWLASELGDRAFTTQHVHRVCRELYRPTPDGLAGDEDNGEMSAWLLWACLGRYPLAPCHGRFPQATPFADTMRVIPDDGGATIGHG
ncbi:MAG: GH92 family glycosyl hydrolase [Planctomycetota bacterium]